MPSVVELLRDHWDIHATGERLIQEANGRRITWVESQQGAFVVKELPAHQELAASLAVLQQLQGLPHAPRLVPTTAGRNLHGAVYVMAAVAGTAPSREPEVQAELGRIARALNSIEGVQHRRPDVGAVIADLAQRDLQLGPDYLRVVESLSCLRDEPLALVHGEINAANARVTAEGTIVLLDWDDVGLGVRWLDAGYPLIQTYLAEDLTFDAAGARAFYRGYTGGAGFTAEEWQLVFTTAVLHALRYLPWGDTAARWRRVLHALAHKQELLESAGR